MNTLPKLDDFTLGYIEALFFTEASPTYSAADWLSPKCVEAQDEGATDGTIPGDVSLADLAPETLADIVEDCTAWQSANAALLTEAYSRGYDATRAGNDYWLTRNGHGAGFWDREALEAGDLGERLSDACRYSEVNVSFESDGKVYVS